MIPKVIHYCWFGGNPKSDIILKCIESWKEYCPDYEIIEWNESNFDVNSITYTKQAYEAKKWAFVSDYARLWCVYQNGGVYLDTDVLLHSSLDELLQYDCWLASEDVKYVSTGLGFGATCKNNVIAKLMETYESSAFDETVNSVLDTTTLEKYFSMWKKSDKTQVIENTLIIGMKDYGKYARHLATFSWKDEEYQKERLEKIRNYQTLKGVKLLIWRFKCVVRGPKLINFFEKRRGTLVEKIYTFCAYDLLEYGAVHFIKRSITKLEAKIKR